MMRIEISQDSKMTEAGKSLYRRLKNHIGILDMFVRESIQNSLDAAKSSEKHSHVNVDFTTGQFKAGELNDRFELISKSLNERYPGTCDFIAIGDKNTVGLTGEVDFRSSNNINNLVYRISREKSDKEAGGYWGIGKTIYLRVGIGLVIYYSRIQEDGRYHERLVASLIENTDPADDYADNENALIPPDIPNRGVAFFGKKTGGADDYSEDTYPFTEDNPDEIESMLSVFGLVRYKDDETGTLIIIPYIDTKKLLDDVSPRITDESTQRPPNWTRSLEDYLSIAIQKWYAPRLNNTDYDGSYLIAWINRKRLTFGMDIASDNRSYGVFSLLAHMYRMPDSDSSGSSILPQEGAEIHRERIDVKQVRGMYVGDLMWALADIGSLEGTETTEEFRNVYSAIGKFEAKQGDPIIAYCRKPAMIVGYETGNSAWISGIQNIPQDKVLIAFFRLNSKADFRDKQNGLDKVEEYVRSCEEEAHDSWADRQGFTLIQKIQSNIQSKLSKAFSKDSTEQYEGPSSISRVMTELFLPDVSLSEMEMSSGGSGPQSKTVTRKKKKNVHNNRRSHFEVLDTALSDGRLIVKFAIDLNNGCPVRLFPVVQTESEIMNSSDWEDEESIGTVFPITLKSLSVDSLTADKKKLKDAAVRIEMADDSIKIEKYLSAKPLRSSRGALYGVQVTSYSDCSMQGTLVFESSERRILVGLDYEVIPQ